MEVRIVQGFQLTEKDWWLHECDGLIHCPSQLLILDWFHWKDAGLGLLPIAKSKEILPVTVVVTRWRATDPLVAIPAMALVPRWRSRCVVGVIPHRAYPYLRIQFLRSEPVSSTKTNISGRNIKHCVVYAPRKAAHRCSATCLIFFASYSTDDRC